MLPDNLNSVQFDSLISIIQQSTNKASGEIYCFLQRKQKKSAQYARKELREIVKASNLLRKMLQETRNAMSVKKKKIPAKV